MSPKKIAFRLREMASQYEYDGEDAVSLQLSEFADEIDGPLKLKPLRPKPGTVVRFADGDVGLAYNNGIAYVAPDGYLISMPWSSSATSLCKPVHILADDEVAVKRSQIQALLGEVGNE